MTVLIAWGLPLFTLVSSYNSFLFVYLFVFMFFLLSFSLCLDQGKFEGKKMEKKKYKYIQG